MVGDAGAWGSGWKGRSGGVEGADHLRAQRDLWSTAAACLPGASGPDVSARMSPALSPRGGERGGCHRRLWGQLCGPAVWARH